MNATQQPVTTLPVALTKAASGLLSEGREITCEHCGRYIGTAYGSVVAELKCGNSSCRATNQVKIVQGDPMKDITFKFANPPQPPKEKKS